MNVGPWKLEARTRIELVYTDLQSNRKSEKCNDFNGYSDKVRFLHPFSIKALRKMSEWNFRFQNNLVRCSKLSFLFLLVPCGVCKLLYKKQPFSGCDSSLS